MNQNTLGTGLPTRAMMNQLEFVSTDNTSQDSFKSRSTKRRIPDTEKNSHYWARRARNNEAARKSRHNRRMAEQELQNKVMQLQEENTRLREEMSAMRKYFDMLVQDAKRNNRDDEGILPEQQVSDIDDRHDMNQQVTLKHPFDAQNRTDCEYQIKVEDELGDNDQNMAGFLGILKEARLVDSDLKGYQLILQNIPAEGRNMLDHQASTTDATVRRTNVHPSVRTGDRVQDVDRSPEIPERSRRLGQVLELMERNKSFLRLPQQHHSH